jgi:esterase/lipase
MNMERPPLPEKSSTTPGSQKRTLLDRVFRHLPAGSRRIAGAMALGAMEAMSDGSKLENTDALSQANDIVQEEKKERIMRDMEAAEAAEQTEQLQEIRKKIRNG